MSEEVITIDSDDDDDPPAPGPSSSMGFNPAHYSDLVQVSFIPLVIRPYCKQLSV